MSSKNPIFIQTLCDSKILNSQGLGFGPQGQAAKNGEAGGSERPPEGQDTPVTSESLETQGCPLIF